MLIFHGWVIYFFYSAACTTEQAALCASPQALAGWQRAPADPWASPSPIPDRGHLPPIAHPAERSPVSPSMLPTTPSPCNRAMGQANRSQAPGPDAPSCDSSVSPRPARQHVEKDGGGSTRILLFVINVHVDSHWWVSYDSRESPDAAAPGAAS